MKQYACSCRRLFHAYACVFHSDPTSNLTGAACCLRISCMHICRDRIHDWVRQASHLERFDNEDPDEISPRQKQHSKFGHGRFNQDGDAEVAVHMPGLGKSPGGKGKFADAYSDDDGGAPTMPSRGMPWLQGRPSDGAGSDAAESFVGSMADGMSDIGSGIDSAVSAGAMGHEEELAVDTRYVC